MKRTAFILVTAALIFACLPALAEVENTDSATRTKELQEVVIEGRTRKVIDNGYLVIPSKNDKKFSTDAYQLLTNISIPQLSVDGNSVTNSANQSVALYVNYMPCSEFEARTLQTKDVLRVEYLENPTDPRFSGAPYVVNFIMKEYIYGGYTSIKAGQYFYNTAGDYLLGSKFTYKQTTMNLFLGDKFSNDPRSGSETSETFRGISYNGVLYDMLTRKTDFHQKNKRNTAYATFKITNVVKNKMYFMHTLAINEMRFPETTGSGSVIYSPEITTQDISTTITSSKRFAPSLRGQYYFQPGMYTFTVDWAFIYMNSRNNSSFNQGDFADIVTNTHEKAYQGNVKFDYTHYFNNNVLSATVSTDLSRYNTNYTGNMVSDQKLFRSSTDFELNYIHRFSDAINLRASAGANLFTSKVNELATANTWSPNFQLMFGWSINSKHRLSALSNFSLAPPQTARLADLTLQRDPLIWQTGNPDLKNSSYIMANATYTWIPNDKFNLSFTPTLMINTNPQTSVWEIDPAVDNGNGICERFINADYYDRLWLHASFTWRPISMMQITGNLKYWRNWMKGVTAEHSDGIEGDMQASVMIKDFMFSASLISPYKQYSFGFSESGWWQYGVSAKYSKGKFSASLGLYSLFLNNKYNKWEYNSPLYSYEKWHIKSRGMVSVSLSYTITYGKKVRQENSWIQLDEISSSVLQGER